MMTVRRRSLPTQISRVISPLGSSPELASHQFSTISPLGSWRGAPRLARLLGPFHRSPRTALSGPFHRSPRGAAPLGSHDFSGHFTARLVARARLASHGHLRAISPLASWRGAPRLVLPSLDEVG